MSLRTADFDYDLPADLIAQVPPAERSSSRLLCLSRQDQSWSDARFSDFVDQIASQDLVIFNDTRVFPARLFGVKDTGGKLECLIERLLDDTRVLAHLKASKTPKPQARLLFEGQYEAVVLGRHGELFELQFKLQEPLLAFLERCGHLPLPPYITRPPDSRDYQRYQTVFAEKVGAVAAPTAGLHFDSEVLKRLNAKGVATAYLTLHVGAGTFQPVRVENLTEHVMHHEWLEVPAAVCSAVQACRARGGRVIAVGTTVLRALEAASARGQIQAFRGETDLFIYPGFEFRCVDALLTNFHLPRSSLLMLVAAFAGHDFIVKAYEHAVAAGYRFFSYGDCMLIS